MQQGRLRLRPWLEKQIQSGKYPGVTWLDETTQVFQIPWKHAARHGWNIDKDATLFRNWAMHTGLHKSGSSLGANSKRLKVPRSSVQTIVRKYKHHGTTQPSYHSGRRRALSPRDERTLDPKSESQSQNNSKGPCEDAGGNRYKPGIDKPDPKTWKANFRCALNTLPHVIELQGKSIKKGSNASRVYMMLPVVKRIERRKGPQKSVDIKHSPISLSENEAHSCAPLDGFAEVFLKYRGGQTSHNPAMFHVEDNYPPNNNEERSPEQPHQSSFIPEAHKNSDANEQADAVFKIVDHLKHLEHWSQSNDNRSWRATDTSWVDSYCEDMDYLGYPMETDCYTYSAQQIQFL